MTSTFTTNLNLQQQGTNDNPGSWGSNFNSNVIALIDNALGSAFAQTLTSSDVTLSTANAGNLTHNLTGTLTTNVNYIFPANAGRFLIIKNGTTGAFSVTVKPSGGTGVVIPQGTTQIVYIDPSNTTAYIPVSAANLGALLATNNLSDLNSASTARTNLGLGTAATQNTGTSGANLPFLNGTNTWGGTNAFQAITATTLTGLSTPLSVAQGGSGLATSDPVVQRVSTITGASTTGTTTIPADDTIPQNTEGDQYMSLAITPKNSANILVIDAIVNISNSVAGQLTVALFQDSGANAIAVCGDDESTAGRIQSVHLRHIMSAGTTSATTFKIRAGNSSAGTTTFNGANGGRIYGGAIASSISIIEYST